MVADLQIPAGYHFTDADGARTLLKKMNNPVPAGLIGILAPTSDEWLAVIEFSDIGHVIDAKQSDMNSKAILKAIQARSEAQNNDVMSAVGVATASVNWESEPAYNENDHSLEWGIRAETQSGKIINHTLVLLGRRGVLDVTMIKSSQSSFDLMPLKQLAKNISFKAGQAYADYQKGDKTTGVSLADLVVDDENPEANIKDLPARVAEGSFGWIYFYYYLLAGGVVGLMGLLLFKNLSMRRKRRTAHHHQNGEPASAVASELSTNGHGHGLNGAKHNGSNGHLTRRRRTANFGKFYTNMILELSTANCNEFMTYYWNPGKPALKAPALLNGTANGNGHGTANGNGHGNGHGTASEPVNPVYGSTNQELMTIQKHLIEELVAIQKNLIEDQRRFILQQSKFIEEKHQLIEEQNRLAERQAEALENQSSFKL